MEMGGASASISLHLARQLPGWPNLHYKTFEIGSFFFLTVDSVSKKRNPNQSPLREKKKEQRNRGNFPDVFIAR